MPNIELRKNYDVDVLIRGWGRVPLARRLIKHLKTSKLLLNVIFVDNGSDRQDLTQLMLDFPMVTYLSVPHPVGSVRALNMGLSQALLSGAKYVLMLDNDIEPPAECNWIEALCAWMRNEAVGAVGAASRNASWVQGQPGPGEPLDEDAPILDNFAMLLRKEALQQVGLFDERFEPGLCEDIDYSIRLHEAGYQGRAALDVWLNHQGNQTIRQFNTEQVMQSNLAKLLSKWGKDKLRDYGLEVVDNAPAEPDPRKISLLVPTLNRHGKLRAMLESVKPLVEADGNIEVVISPMEDDHVAKKIIKDYAWAVCAPRPESERSAVAGFNWCYRHATGDILVVGGDDVDYCAPDFFQVIRQCVSKLPEGEGMAESKIGPLEAMQAVTRGFVRDYLGGSFMCPHYYSWFANTEQTARAVQARRYVLTDKARVASPNPILDGSEKDATYQEGEAHHEADKQLFFKRMAANFPNDYPPLETVG